MSGFRSTRCSTLEEMKTCLKGFSIRLDERLSLFLTSEVKGRNDMKTPLGWCFAFLISIQLDLPGFKLTWEKEVGGKDL